MSTRETTATEREVMEYLNVLRESGVTNMFGAAPYIVDEFEDLSRAEATRILKLWMGNFNMEGNYETVKED
jgi:hypothetical protein